MSGKVAGYDYLNLSSEAALIAVPLCLECRALVWDEAFHTIWHARLARTATQANRADAWTTPIGGKS